MEKILQTWLSHQCRMMSGSIHAVLLTGPPDEGPFNRVLYWPEKQGDYSGLSRVAQTALHTKQVLLKSCNNKVEKTGEPLDAIACPLFLSDRFFGVVAIELTNRSKSMQQATARQVQAGVKWLETMIQLHGSTAKKQLVNLVDLVVTGL